MKSTNLASELESLNLSLLQISDLANELKFFSRGFYANSKHKPAAEIIKIVEEKTFDIKKLIEGMSNEES